jgi:hypothetical protein
MSEKLCNKSLYLIVGQNPIADIILGKSGLELAAPESLVLSLRTFYKLLKMALLSFNQKKEMVMNTLVNWK